MLTPNFLLLYVQNPMASATFYEKLFKIKPVVSFPTYVAFSNEDKLKECDVQIEQDLHEAVFGLTFVALDPDGHRIRVCIPDKDK